MSRSGWLEQKRPSDGALRVRDYPGELVRIACRHCDRVRRYRRAGLAAVPADRDRHGGDDAAGWRGGLF